MAIRMIDRVAARALTSQHPLWKKLDRVGAKLWGNPASALDARTLAALGAGGPKVTVADLTHMMATVVSPPPPPSTGRTGSDPNRTAIMPAASQPSDRNHPQNLLNLALGIKPTPKIKYVYSAAALATLATLFFAAPAVLIIGISTFVLAGAVHGIYRLAQNLRVSRAWEKLATVTRGNPGNIQILADRLKDRPDDTVIVRKLNDIHLMADVFHAIAWLKLPEASRSASGILGDPLFKTYANPAVINADLAKLRAMKTARGIASHVDFEATVQARIDKLSALPGAQQTSTVTLLSNPASYENDLDSIIRGEVVSLNLTSDQLGTLLGRARQIADGVPALSAKSRSARDMLYTLLNDEGGRGNA